MDAWDVPTWNPAGSSPRGNVPGFAHCELLGSLSRAGCPDLGLLDVFSGRNAGAGSNLGYPTIPNVV